MNSWKGESNKCLVGYDLLGAMLYTRMFDASLKVCKMRFRGAK